MTWISVKDRLPCDENRKIVAYFNSEDNKYIIGTSRYSGKYWWNWKNPENITHWMPLPEPPEEIKSGVIK